MDTHIFFAQETSSQVQCKWVHVLSSLLKNFFSQVFCKLVAMSSFIKIFVKPRVVDPTHEQIKYVQSSIKSTQF
jgi:hypothetical protein